MPRRTSASSNPLSLLDPGETPRTLTLEEAVQEAYRAASHAAGIVQALRDAIESGPRRRNKAAIVELLDEADSLAQGVEENVLTAARFLGVNARG
jgi:hypothetical protein